MNKEDEKRILSVQDILHLQSDTHDKKHEVMPDVDTSRYVLTKKAKTEAVRKFVTTANITDEQRRQFSQGDAAPNKNAKLAEQCRVAIKVAETNAEKLASENAKNAPDKPPEPKVELTRAIKTGKFDFDFGALTEGAENLKETI